MATIELDGTIRGFEGSILDRERTIATAGFNRWLVPPAALCIHLCINKMLPIERTGGRGGMRHAAQPRTLRCPQPKWTKRLILNRKLTNRARLSIWLQ